MKGRVLREPNWKLPAKNKYTCGNISRIYSENLWKLWMNQSQKYFSPMASPKKPSQPKWCYIKTQKVKVRSPDGDTDYFDMVAGVLLGDTLAPYPFIICLDYMLRMSIDLMKENSFRLAKKRSRRYPAQTIMDAMT